MKTKAMRRQFAAQLKAEREKLSAPQQLARLDKRLGAGVGAKKERARLNSLKGK